MLTWIADHIGHGRFLPMLVDLPVAFLAGLGADVMCRTRNLLLLRLFALRERAKAAYEKNEPPTVVALYLVWITPRRHAGQLYAIFNDVMDFAVGKSLGRCGAQIGHARVKRLSHRRQPASVVPVAGLATCEESVAASLQRFWRRFERIFFAARGIRDGKISCGVGDHGFEAGRLIGGAKTAMNQECRAH